MTPLNAVMIILLIVVFLITLVFMIVSLVSSLILKRRYKEEDDKSRREIRELRRTSTARTDVPVGRTTLPITSTDKPDKQEPRINQPNTGEQSGKDGGSVKQDSKLVGRELIMSKIKKLPQY